MDTLLPYQARWTGDDSAIKVCEKSRRIGLSWAAAYDAALYAARKKGGGNVYYQAYDLTMTRGFISDCAAWAGEIKDALPGRITETLLDLGNGKAHPAHRLPLASGNEVLAMTSAPRAFRSRGRPGDRAIVDEAAFVDDLPAVLKAAMAFRMWGGQVHVMSTHNGETNAFAHLVRDVRDGKRPGSLHSIPFDAAVSDGLAERILTVTGRDASPEAQKRWVAETRAEYGEFAAEELDCIPSAGGGAWLSWDTIRACEHPDAGDPAKAGDGPKFIGTDIARRGDLWVATVLELAGNVLWVREIAVKRNIPFVEQHRILDELHARWHPVRNAIDQTGMGEEFVEVEQRKHGATVEGVLLTAPRRLSIATILREALEDRRMRLPPDEKLRRDLHSVKRVAGATGAPRLVAENESDGHADRFWAAAMATAAASGGPRRYAYFPIGTGEIRLEDGLWVDDLGPIRDLRDPDAAMRQAGYARDAGGWDFPSGSSPLGGGMRRVGGGLP